MTSGVLTTEFRAFLQRLDNAELGDDVGEEEEQGRVLNLILQFVLDVRLGEITKITFICIILKEKIVWPGKKKRCNSQKKFVCVAFLFMRDY